MCSGVNRVSIFAWTKSAFQCGLVNHATFPKLYWSYYPHRSRELVSPVCGIFEHDVRTVTGRNLRNTLLLTDKSSVLKLSISDINNVKYYKDPEMWQESCVKEILQIKDGEKEIPEGWTMDEINFIFNAACCD